MSRVLLISDAGGQPRDFNVTAIDAVAPVLRPEQAVPPVQVGSGTSEVRIRVDFALSRR